MKGISDAGASLHSSRPRRGQTTTFVRGRRAAGKPGASYLDRARHAAGRCAFFLARQLLGEVARAVDALERAQLLDEVGRDDDGRGQGRGTHVDDEEEAEDGLAVPILQSPRLSFARRCALS